MTMPPELGRDVELGRRQLSRVHRTEDRDRMKGDR
jgi:hypothetical protein